MNKRFKKSVSVLTSVTTAFWLSGVAMLAPIAASAADVVDGDLIRNPDAEGAAQFDVYIVKTVDDKQYKRLILSPHVFESYEHFDKNGNGNNWDDVMDVDQATMDQFTTSDLVRVDGGTKVYRLHAEEGADTGDKYWLDMTADTFTDYFEPEAIYTINSTDVAGYDTGSDVTDPAADFPPTAGDDDDDDDVISDGTLSVTLAADTPAAGVAVQNAARLPFTKVNLTATGGDVVVDQLVVERTGLAQDAAFSSVDVIDGDTELAVSNTSKTFNSVHQATFNDDVTVEEGTTKSLILAGNMVAALGAYAGETPSLTLDSVTVKDDANISASLPITGNTMTINSTITIGTATIKRGAYTNATSTSIQVGVEDYTFFSFQVQAGSAEKIAFDQIRVYQEGSASLGSDVINLELYQEGTKIADGEVSSSKYADFTFDEIVINKGEIAQFQVKADVDGGSARTVNLGIYRATDLLVTGETYGYNITPTYRGDGSADTSPVLSDNKFTISNGTLQVTRSNEIGAENIGVGNDQYLGAYKFTGKGEPINVTALTLTVASTGAGSQIEDALRNVEIVDPDGDVVAGPNDLTSDKLTVAWTDTFTVPVGETVYKVRGDLASNGGWSSDDTITVSFTPSAMTATGEETGNSITPSPGSAVSGNTQTVKAANLKVTKNTLPADSSIIVNQNDVTLSSWNFSAAASGEPVRVTSIKFAGRGQAATNTNNLTLYVDGEAQIDDIQDALSTQPATTTFALTDPIVIPKGESVTIELHGDKDSVDSDATENWGLADPTGSVICYGANTNQSFAETLTVDDGPTLTSRSRGTMTINLASRPSSGVVLAGSSGNTFVKVEFKTRYEEARLDELVVNLFDGDYEFSPTASYSDVTQVCLYDEDGDYLTGSADGSCASMAAATHTFNFDSDDLNIDKDSSANVTIKADMSTIDPNSDDAPGSVSADVKLGFGGANGVKFTGLSSNLALTGAFETYNDSTSSYQVLMNSMPKLTFSSASDSLGAATSLSDGDIVIFAFDIEAEGDDVYLYRTTFGFATSNGSDIGITDTYLKDQDDNRITTIATPTYMDGPRETWRTVTFDNPDVSIDDATEAIKIPAGETKRFKLHANISGSSANEYIKVRIIGDTASTSNQLTANFADSSLGSGAGGWTPATADFTDADTANFVWSDNYKDISISATGVGSSATNTAMWFNGYLISGLEKTASTTEYTLSR